MDFGQTQTRFREYMDFKELPRREETDKQFIKRLHRKFKDKSPYSRYVRRINIEQPQIRLETI